jgi:kynurenine formamidase
VKAFDHERFRTIAAVQSYAVRAQSDNTTSCSEPERGDPCSYAAICGSTDEHKSELAMHPIDLTHRFTQHMPVYPGDPPARLEPIAHIGKDEYNMYCLCSGMHVGTHIDAPLHMIAGGKFICDMPVTQFFGRGRLIDARGQRSIAQDLLQAADISAGDIVLILTGWYHRFGDDTYYTDYPELLPDFARQLVKIGVSIVGLDTPSPDRSPFVVHKILLSAEVLIIENLTNLEALLGIDEFDVVALPAKLHCEAAPVRVVAQPRGKLGERAILARSWPAAE